MLFFKRKREEMFKKDEKKMREIDDYVRNLQIVIIAGGYGERLKHRTKGKPKPLLEIGGKTLLEWCLEHFSHKVKDFVLLVGHGAREIKNFLGDGSKFGIRVKYSEEKTKLGKGGALKWALENGAIDDKKPALITYPDDLILVDNFLEKIVERHLKGLEKGCKATVVRVTKTRYPYGVVKTDDEGIVVDFEEKPFINLPANVGIYLIEPEVFDIIKENVDLSKIPVEFEETVVPELVKRRWLFSMTIPWESWIPVNDEKSYKRAVKTLEDRDASTK
ncbi:MAG: nucleotidyltransferase family protein [Candidatus Aenigmarchaeota archaeon]|nr:nucleotidyltransferase family protein [Candidatus Aenigmarchaeota archaeon]